MTRRHWDLFIASASDNLIRNPSFEDTDLSIDWSYSAGTNWSYTNEICGRKDSTYFIYGSYACKVGNGLTAARGIAEKGLGVNAHPVIPGETLKIGFDIMSPDPASQFLALFKCYDSAGVDITGIITPPSGWPYSGTYGLYKQGGVSADSAWARKAYNFIVPDSVSYIRFGIQVYNGGSLFYLWADGVKLSRSNSLFP
jgi:hypothetical protein